MSLPPKLRAALELALDKSGYSAWVTASGEARDKCKAGDLDALADAFSAGPAARETLLRAVEMDIIIEASAKLMRKE